MIINSNNNDTNLTGHLDAVNPDVAVDREGHAAIQDGGVQTVRLL